MKNYTNNIWGVNSFGHDASICVLNNNQVLFHEKNGSDFLTQELVERALTISEPDLICYYENPWIKKTRQFFSGDFKNAVSLYTPRIHLYELGIFSPIKYFTHHQSHAAAGFYTSPFEECVILVADAIGEWNTMSLWHAKNNKLYKLKVKNYPYSLGLFYSAFTEVLGLCPNKDENKVMEMSVEGDPLEYYDNVKYYLGVNVHKGIKRFEFKNKLNLAAAVQKIFEEELINFVKPHIKCSNNLVFMGGCAYNKLAKTKLNKFFKTIYTTRNPGDFNSSLGAACCYLKTRIKLQEDVYEKTPIQNHRR